MGYLFEEHARRAGLDVVMRSAGTKGITGEAPTDEAVRILRARGIDVSGYRSHVFGDHGILGADLIVTARQHHVVSVAGRWPNAFRYTFTLPEIVGLADEVGPREGRPLDDWLDLLGKERGSPLDYLDSKVGEIADPTGRSPAEWKAAYGQIDDLTARLADLLR